MFIDKNILYYSFQILLFSFNLYLFQC